ncbi:biotin--[acetyl-CoA-carboxylase] ligase [Flavicella sediminum]|uniref:biotin--[acetyl-CoA-carboxylase] ligase n=1 Tax=Flavicella sediminum TaxID=2585141 RepID=UPI001123FFD8|nr:biotin--[acetyl-CoA-carboxylase] ligase [Flavicella sediminum]
MHIIKLDAIGSTNTFLKDYVSNGGVENYTVVTAEEQTHGRGQVGAKWYSEPGKNLMFSVFCGFQKFKFVDYTYLNYTVSLAVFEVLKRYGLSKLKIKWPNDIMAGNRKIGGILIENVLNKEEIKHSIIGVGLNVNQSKFSEEFGKASSLKKKLGKNIDRTVLLNDLIVSIKSHIEFCVPENFEAIKASYLQALYKKEIPTMFKDSEDAVFIGKIKNVSNLGKLQVELEDESIKEFEIKEIQLIN